MTNHKPPEGYGYEEYHARPKQIPKPNPKTLKPEKPETLKNPKPNSPEGPKQHHLKAQSNSTTLKPNQNPYNSPNKLKKKPQTPEPFKDQEVAGPFCVWRLPFLLLLGTFPPIRWYLFITQLLDELCFIPRDVSHRL